MNKLREHIYDMVMESAISDYKRGDIGRLADQILQAVIDELPEANKVHDDDCQTWNTGKQEDCTCGANGWDAYRSELLKRLEGHDLS